MPIFHPGVLTSIHSLEPGSDLISPGANGGGLALQGEDHRLTWAVVGDVGVRFLTGRHQQAFDLVILHHLAKKLPAPVPFLIRECWKVGEFTALGRGRSRPRPLHLPAACRGSTPGDTRQNSRSLQESPLV